MSVRTFLAPSLQSHRLQFQFQHFQAKPIQASILSAVVSLLRDKLGILLDLLEGRAGGGCFGSVCGVVVVVGTRAVGVACGESNGRGEGRGEWSGETRISQLDSHGNAQRPRTLSRSWPRARAVRTGTFSIFKRESFVLFFPPFYCRKHFQILGIGHSSTTADLPPLCRITSSRWPTRRLPSPLGRPRRRWAASRKPLPP